MKKIVKDRDLLAANPLEQLALLEDKEHVTYVSIMLTEDECDCLWKVLGRNKDVFTWKHSNLPGINPTIASHKLNIIFFARLMQQRVQHFHSNWKKIMQVEVDNLLRAGFTREVSYSN